MENKLHTALLTIEQAHNRWCPEASVPATNDDDGSMAATNRYEGGGQRVGAHCLGDACMFWRWHDRAERPQPDSLRFAAKLSDDLPAAREGGCWAVFVPEIDDGEGSGWFDSLAEARTEATAGIREQIHGSNLEAGIQVVLERTACQFRFVPDPLPPRGFCGRAGHPLQADLHDIQMRLAAAGLNEITARDLRDRR